MLFRKVIAVRVTNTHKCAKQPKADAICRICYALNGQYFYSSFGTGT